ncbi:MAG: F0F1 ATP synthase subunit epsilon [Pyrinomonadaceae bacterium]|nr:F0F1 ATP synthase subunit epsilon [Pyrinomonadaceae bacterium]
MLNLEIVTPAKMVLSDTVDSVTVPTATGEVGILSNHAPLISALKPGILSVSKGGSVEKMVVSGGFVEVSSNKVSVLTDIAEKSGEIDVESARAAKAEAEKVLGSWKDGSAEDFEIESERLEKANAQLQLAAGR